MSEEFKAGPAEHVPFDLFGLGVDAFRPAVVMRERDRSDGGLEVEFEAAGERVQVGHVSGPRGGALDTGGLSAGAPPELPPRPSAAGWGSCRALTAITANRSPYMMTAISTNAAAIALRPIWWSRMNGPAVSANQDASRSAQMKATRVPVAMAQLAAKAGPERVYSRPTAGSRSTPVVAAASAPNPQPTAAATR